MIETRDLARELNKINQSEIMAYLNYTEILQLKAIIFKIRGATKDDETD